jgi:hypothetical protein
MALKVVRIGVTGHRFLNEPEKLKSSICDAMRIIHERHPKATFELISPLSEGADQLTAECALADGKTDLVALLPMPLEKYLLEFSSEEKAEFMRLYEKHTDFILLPGDDSMENAYLSAGEYLIEHCDYLIAVWNGREERGKGGTAQVVRLAMEKKMPIAWIRGHNAIPEGVLPVVEDLPQGSVEFFNWV